MKYILKNLLVKIVKWFKLAFLTSNEDPRDRDLQVKIDGARDIFIDIVYVCVVFLGLLFLIVPNIRS